MVVGGGGKREKEILLTDREERKKEGVSVQCLGRRRVVGWRVEGGRSPRLIKRGITDRKSVV